MGRRVLHGERVTKGQEAGIQRKPEGWLAKGKDSCVHGPARGAREQWPRVHGIVGNEGL